MADTQRTITEILALCADNTAGAISPQDIRDVIETLKPTFGGLYVTVPAATTLATGVMTKAAGTTALTHVHNWSMPTNNRLQYNGVAGAHGHIAASVSLTCAGNNQDIRVGIAKNGSVIASSILSNRILTGSDVRSTALHTDDMLAPGDYLEFFVANDSGTSQITMQQGYLFCMTMPEI